ncbi:serine/threonine-protein kinase [Lipingzhangella sp. LS1_29]|uniref:Serine/threonine-protein kinase n=1 Tax=Lipingzhangella rawalii TaxID=2055835 RepID=A0ABU2H4Z0_9ACTN|nr:serine/threonine-protein kinase [Lipingzhangella rawalii]MDS1270372.1 serine/threonine-protein kinase [Lipingzhangella rawalii]
MPPDGLPKNLEPLAAGDPASIGPYMLAGRLGSGGMGTVYLGRTPQRDALVAIKVIRPELAFDEATRARFRDEMENAQRVASFCTAKIIDHGTFENRPYMVTEYIAGTALAEHIATHGALDSSTLHGFSLGVAAALAAIHGAGLVHRDLKPANVLLSLSGPRVIDFGIARALNTATSHTQTGIVMGSPGWMAPEQLLEETVTTAADIFAWGCLVAFAGTGQHPFGNGDAMTLGKRVLFAEPQLGQLDAPLDRLVPAALAKEAERRPKAQDLLLELAGGGNDTGDSGDPNAMISQALNQSWRPNLPPMMPPASGPAPAGAAGPPGGAPAQHPGPPPGHPGYGPQQAGPPPGSQQPPHPGGAPGGQHPPHHTDQFSVVGAHGPHVPGQPQGPPAPHQQAGHQQAGHHTGPVPQVAPPGGNQRPSTQPYVPPVPPSAHHPAPPEQRRTRWLTISAVVGVVLLLVLFVSLTWLGASGGVSLPWQTERAGEAAQTSGDSQDNDGADPDDPGNATEAQPGVEDPETGPEPEDALGRVHDDWIEFTVFAPECTRDAGGPTSLEDAAYWEFEVSARNLSSGELELSPERQLLHGDGGPTLEAEPVLGSAERELWEPIGRGETAEGTMVFVVPDEIQPNRLVLRGSEDSPGAELSMSGGAVCAH